MPTSDLDTGTDLVVTSCADHGVKVESSTAAGALESFRVHVAAALACLVAGDHRHYGDSCWVCCDGMVIDPAGVLGEVYA